MYRGEVKTQMSNNEKLKIILSDPLLYIQKFIRICDKSGDVIPFILNEPQKHFHNNFEKFNIILKSRQLGFSTYCMAYSIYIALTKRYSTCLMMSYSLDSATGIFEKLKQMYDLLPNAVKIPTVQNNRKELKFTNGSKIIVATAGNKDIGRGLTLDYVHMSELAFMTNPNKQLLSIEQALKPKGICTIESTANGLNDFYKLCQDSKNGVNAYKYFFFKWYDDKEMFKQDYKFAIDLLEKRGGTIPAYDDLSKKEKFLIDDGATIEQIVWRRMKIANCESEEQFLQEFPEDDIGCFVSSGKGVFDNTKIVERIQYITKPINVINLPDVLALQSKQHLQIWHTPKIGMKYYIGVDSSEGLGQDSSVIEVYDEEGVQCCEYRNNKVEPYRFAQICYEIGLYYNYGHLIVEKASGGHTVVDKLKNEYHYANMHKAKMYDDRGRSKRKVGFMTTSKTKPLIINMLREGFNEGQILINSGTSLEEMKTYVMDSKGSMNAIIGQHDDTVMANAMAIYGLNKGVYYAKQ